MELVIKKSKRKKEQSLLKGGVRVRSARSPHLESERIKKGWSAR